MGLAQWAHANEGGEEGHAPLPDWCSDSLCGSPSAASLPFTPPSQPSGIQAPRPMGHPSGLLSSCKVQSGVPSLALAPNSPATPGLWQPEMG